MCVRYRFPKIELSARVCVLEMPKFQAASPELYQRKLDCWIEGGLRMTADFVIGLATCIATVINTVFVALSYLKGKDKE